MENFRVFCQELYEYIVQYKREINLFEKVEAIVDKVSIKMKSSIDDFLSSSKGKGLIKTYLPQLNDLLQKLKNDQTQKN